ncbi:MAG: hypothetical protein ACXWLL_10030, partial [Myxococcaceae bacterium]
MQVPFAVLVFPMHVNPGTQAELSSQLPPAPTGFAQSKVFVSQTRPGPQPLLAHEEPTVGGAAHTPQLLVR